ncbi:MAG: ABC transporter permease subunit [bacterium]
MKNIIIITKKELASYFNSPIAYIFISIFLIVANWLFFESLFLGKQASMRFYFSLLPWMFLFLAPAITMRLFAEEKKSGTIETLLTLPISDWEVVLAKFFSALIFLVIALALSLTTAITVGALGKLDWGPVVGGYIGAILMGAVFIALGSFISSFTKNQIIALLIGVALCFALFIISSSFVLSSVSVPIAKILSFLGVDSHFSNIQKGVIDSRDIIYYFSFIFIFLWMSVKSLEARKWR